MYNGMPPLVDRDFAQRPDTMMNGRWPPAPPTPSWQGQSIPQPDMAQGWGGFDNSGWAQQGTTLTPMMMPAQPGPAFPIIPPPMAQVAQPVAMGNNDWARAGSAPWEPPADGFPRDTGRAQTPFRSSSVRSQTPRTPFTDDSSPLSQTSNISRSRSFTGSVRAADKRPPREWRPDFSTTKSPKLAALGSFFSKTTTDPGSVPRVELHPYLRYIRSSPSIYLDLRENPANVRFRDLGRPINSWDLSRFTCEPPLPTITLVSRYFPWYIEVQSNNPSGVTLYDLLWQISICMSTVVTAADYWNNEMDQVARERVAEAWALRCGDNQDERNQGIRRVDFLMDRVVLQGFTRSKDGTWEMKVKRPS